jgi:hypothetical protein
VVLAGELQICGLDLVGSGLVIYSQDGVIVRLVHAVALLRSVTYGGGGVRQSILSDPVVETYHVMGAAAAAAPSVSGPTRTAEVANSSGARRPPLLGTGVR